MGTTPVLVKPLTQVNTTDPDLQFDGVGAAIADGGYWMAWEDDSFTYNQTGRGAVVVQRYDSAGNRVGGEVPFLPPGFSGSASQPAIAAFGSSDLAVAYTRNFQTALSVNLHHTSSLQISRNNASDPALTTFADGSFILAYTSGSGADTDIGFTRVVPTPGAPAASTIVHDEADNSSNVELATLSDGNFVAVFQDEFSGDSTDNDIRFRIFTATGTPVNPAAGSVAAFVTGGFGTEDERDPDVAALAGGGFVVVWTDGGINENSDIRATILTNAGTLVRGDILVNATQAGAQNEASVVGLLDGGFLVSWEDDNVSRVRAQRFDAVGNPVGDQFTVDDFALTQGSPDAFRLADGRIVLTLSDGVLGDTDVYTSIWNPRGTVAEVGDVLWQQADGTVAIAAREIAQAPNGSQTQGTGDFDGDGDSDVLLRQGDAVRTWELENGQRLGADTIGVASGHWAVRGVGDFDADGDDDILWSHQDGAVVSWEMEDGGYVVNHNIAVAGGAWEIAGTGDFDDDGDDDILWHHTSGQAVTWEMENGGYVVNHNIAVAGGSWGIAGTGDFDGDGDDDILWHHASGQVVAWEMENGGYVVNHNIAVVAGSWVIAGTGDFNADGTDDILWRHGDGQVVTWEMQDSALVQVHDFGVTGNDWQIRGTGEFDLV